jgi:integrase
MGTISRRGTRDKPAYYASYVDADGRRKMRRLRVKTKEEAKDVLANIEARVTGGRVGMEPLVEAPLCGPLMDQWIETLTNRNKQDDKSRFKRHVRSFWAGKTIAEAQELGTVMIWMDLQRAKGKLSAGSLRHNMNLLSRFFSWAVERRFAKVNPVRQIPIGKRPQGAVKRDVPWLNDDKAVRNLMGALPIPLNCMFYLGNRSGLRSGEIAGLRMSDMGYLSDGAIRVRYSYGGPLKEDKQGVGKMKWVPAPIDAEEVLRFWLARRTKEGAGPEDLLFPCPPSPRNPRKSDWKGYRKEQIEDLWDTAATTCNVKMTWYQATRHSFVTRNLENGASLDEVSEAVGHSSPVVTKRFYDHHVRKSFSPTLRTGLAAGAGDER